MSLVNTESGQPGFVRQTLRCPNCESILRRMTPSISDAINRIPPLALRFGGTTNDHTGPQLPGSNTTKNITRNCWTPRSHSALLVSAKIQKLQNKLNEFNERIAELEAAGHPDRAM